MNRSDHVVIVGGGSSGWMTAASLSRFFPKKKITVIESPDVPRIGVGESTLEHFTFFIKSIGVDPEDLFRYCDATYKFSIKFNNFYKQGDGGFHYPFGESSHKSPIFNKFGLEAWQYLKWKYPDLQNSHYAESYYPVLALCNNSTININENRELDNFNFRVSYAYHFDANMFANFLHEKVCVPRGVNYIPGTVVSVNQNEYGIESVTLDSGDVIDGDLFIDCTGFKNVLLKELGAEWMDYSDIIPNNRAWAARVPYTDVKKQMECYTNCTALGNGWVWNTPTWSRLGTGYVYSDRYTTPELALMEFKNHLEANGYKSSDLNFRDLHFRVGMQKEVWKKNCVAIGLSAGFIEPLESTGLYTTITFVNRLVETLNYEGFNQYQIHQYNTVCRADYDGLAKFTASHYMYTQREDTQYWKDCRLRDYNAHLVPHERVMPQTQYNSDYFSQEIMSAKYFTYRFSNAGGSHCILAGCNQTVLNDLKILKDDYYRNGPSIKQLNMILPDMLEKVNRRISEWNKVARSSESHYDYLMRRFHS